MKANRDSKSPRKIKEKQVNVAENYEVGKIDKMSSAMSHLGMSVPVNRLVMVTGVDNSEDLSRLDCIIKGKLTNELGFSSGKSHNKGISHPIPIFQSTEIDSNPSSIVQLPTNGNNLTLMWRPCNGQRNLH